MNGSRRYVSSPRTSSQGRVSRGSRQSPSQAGPRTQVLDSPTTEPCLLSGRVDHRWGGSWWPGGQSYGCMKGNRSAVVNIRISIWSSYAPHERQGRGEIASFRRKPPGGADLKPIDARALSVHAVVSRQKGGQSEPTRRANIIIVFREVAAPRDSDGGSALLNGQGDRPGAESEARRSRRSRVRARGRQVTYGRERDGHRLATGIAARAIGHQGPSQRDGASAQVRQEGQARPWGVRRESEGSGEQLLRVGRSRASGQVQGKGSRRTSHDLPLITMLICKKASAEPCRWC